MKKRTLSLLLAGTLVTLLAMPVYAEEVVYDDIEDISDPIITQDGPGGMEETDIEEEEPEVIDEVTIDENGLESRYYPIDNYPPVKADNWDPKGLAWPMNEAFAYTAAAEIQAFKRGKTEDLSEAALDYFWNNPVQDPLGLLDGSNETAGGFKWYDGWVINKPMHRNKSLANWIGMVDESVMPYTGMTNYINGSGIPGIQYSISADKYHLQNWREFKLWDYEDIPKVKQWIKDKGSVVVQYSRYSNCYNKATKGYYYAAMNGSVPSNTASTALLVGWDDNYSKDNFDCYYEDENTHLKPTKNGAWLMRASSNDKVVTDDYFWISYEDQALCGKYNNGTEIELLFGSAYGLDFEDASNYKYNYQYDGSYSDYNIATSTIMLGANVFTAATNDPLKAVGVEFYTPINVKYNHQPKSNYVIKVYKNCEANKPDTGEVVATLSGKQDVNGFYTLKLPNPVPMTAGTRFSVVLELSNEESMPNVLVAEATFKNVYSGEYRYASVATAKPGQSFYKRRRVLFGKVYDDEWEDVTKNKQYYNLRIKAYTGGTGGSVDPNMPFADVPAGSYYYDPVKWAVSKGVTTGTSATTFSPANACKRGQVVTFLWRAAGKPNPTSSTNPFADVRSNDFYYQPVLWAVEKNITTGVAPNRFAPESTVTRGQVVTFLWRAKGQPNAAASGKFVDVPASAYYAKAVDWAVSNNITTGVASNRFAPGDNCTRAQVVTFLYRAYAK